MSADHGCRFDRSGTCTVCGSYDYDPYRDSLAIGPRPDGTVGTITCAAEGCIEVVRSWSHEGLCKEHHLDLLMFRDMVEVLRGGGGA